MAKKTERTIEFSGDNFSAFGGHPLHVHVASLKAAAVGEGEGPPLGLAELGVTAAEQLVALANVEEKRQHLAATLKVSKQELDNLVKEAKRILPAPVAAEMEHPLPPQYPLGALEPPPELQAAAEAQPDGTLMEAAGLSSAVNLIPHLSAIRQQGQRGTCVSFALTAINEYCRNLRGSPQDLSEQHLYHETKLIDGAPTVCGTWQRFAAQILASRGQCREVIWPYNPNLPCNNNGVMPANARTDAANYKLSLKALNPKNVNLIKAALTNRCPVAISIPVFNSWYTSPETRRSGRITMPLVSDPQVGGHAVCLAGYQDIPSAPGGGYFLLRNSWGPGWGYQDPYGQGYGTIPYQYLTAYNWEAFTLTNPVSLDIPATPQEEAKRTITITIRGNVNLIIE